MNYYKLTNKKSGEVIEGDFATVDEALAAAGLWMASETKIEKRVRDGFRVVKQEELGQDTSGKKTVKQLAEEADKLIEESKQEPPPGPGTDTGDGVKPEPEFTAEDFLTDDPAEEPAPGPAGYPPESLLPKIKAYSEALVIDSSLYSAIGDEYKVKSIVRQSAKPDDVFEWEYELLRIKDDWTAKHNLWEISELFTLGEEPGEEPPAEDTGQGAHLAPAGEVDEPVRKVVGEPTELEAKALEHKQLIEAYAIQAEVVFLEMGKLLYDARVGAEWSILSYESYKAYIEDLQLPMTNSYSWATRLSNIYEYMIKKMGLDPKFIAQIGVAKATRLLPLARKGELTQEVLDAALTLSDLDLRETLGHNVTGGEGETEDSIICPRCGEVFNAKKAARVK